MAGNNDTGTGGINVDGDLYTMDVGVPDQQGGKQGPWSPGDVSVDNNVKDITKPTKETFAKYLSKKTLGLEGSSTHPNAYPVGKGDQTTVTDIELNDANGVPTKPYETNNESKFASIGVGSPPPDGIKRGYDPNLPNAKDGNTLLPTAAVPAQSDQKFIKFTDLSEPVKKYTQGVLDGNLYREDPLDDKGIAESTGGVNDFFGPKFLQVATPNDAGTFDNLAKASQQQQKVTKVTLQDYMRRQVTGKENVPGEVSNKYLPPENNTDLFTNDPATGYPVAPKQTSANSDTSYEPNLASSYSDAAAGLDSSFNRGKAVNPYPDGNSVLKDAAPPATDGSKFVQEQNEPVKGYVSRVLEKNRFTSGRTFVPLGPDGKFAKFGDPPFGPDTDGDTRKTFERNSAMAARSGMKMGEALPPDDDSRGYTFRRLAKVGNVLQLRATGEIIALTDTSVDPLDPLTGLAAYAPGAGQAGAGVPLPIEQLNVESIIADLADPSNESEDSSRFNGTLLNFSSKFEGVINSTFEKFSSFAPIGMIALVTVMVVTIAATITIFGGLFGMTNNAIRNRPGPTKGKAKEGPSGRKGMGAYNGSANFRSADDIISMFLPTGGDSSQIARFFGIMPTRRNSFEAIRIGALNFFGVTENYKPVTTFQSPGYYLTMARAIVRSVSQVVLACEEFGKLLATGNFTAGIEQLLELLLKIKYSRFVSVMNIFGQIGDATPDTEKSNVLTEKDLDNGEYISTAASRGQYDSYGKGRWDPKNSVKLSWATDRAPSLLALPNKTKTLGKILGMDNFYPDESLGNNKGSRKIEQRPLENNSPRISDNDREEIEKKFDAEYVPFYLHDLRTNEILGFHAFLTNIGDSYSAQYDSADGFGRIDPVKIYKNTTRKIDIGFIIASTNQEDLHVMWDKINKLTTMVYPQMTAGKRIGVSVAQKGDFIFTKPFTQQIGAAPMVRLRLGDLFSSNYSKFNLAGIFGLGDETTVMGSKKHNDSGYALQSAKNSIVAKRLTEPGNQAALQKIDEIEPGDQLIVNMPSIVPDIGNAPGDLVIKPPEFARLLERIVDSELGNCFYFTVEFVNFSAEFAQYTGDTIYYHQGKIVARPEEELNDRQKEKLKNYRKETADGAIQNIEDAYFQISSVNIIGFGAATKKKKQDAKDAFKAGLASEQEAKEKLGASPPFAEALVNFLNEKDNAIVRSFKSTSGKGIAGFIDSLSLDWNSGTWSTPGESELRGDVGVDIVPKMCKVTISFTPIHDISPGLTHDGFNRAPIYSVGSFKQKKNQAQSNGSGNKKG